MMNKFNLYFSQEKSDIVKAQYFRGQIFRGGKIDEDPLDERAIHGLIHDQTGKLVCVFRMLILDTQTDLDQSYSSQFYGLDGLKDIGGRALELGRFCVDPNESHPDIIRLAWAELTQYIYENNIQLLFGCSSFQGTDIHAHAEALALLKERHLAPKPRLPMIKAPKVFEFAKRFRFKKPDLKLAQKAMPPLLRSYLMMGGWVSDHAVIDHDLGTVHVFTGVEVSKIPPARKRLFEGLIGQKNPFAS